jgi:hypothetical protein
MNALTGEVKRKRVLKRHLKCPGIAVIAYADRTEDPGFESRQGVRFLVFIHTLQCCCQNLTCIAIVFICEKYILKNERKKKKTRH